MGNEMAHIRDKTHKAIDHVFFCKTCPSFVNQSVVTFSEALVLKVSDGVPPDPKSLAIDEDGAQTTFLTDDTHIFKQLKCIDDTHSVEYGLRKQDFDRLLAKLENLTKIERCKIADKIDTILECYALNPKCPLKCTEQVDDFMDYIDIRRLQTIKEHADEEHERKREEEIKAKATASKT